MNKEKQIEEMVKAKKCDTCIHNAICSQLEEFRDPLGWISTKGEFVCSYYDAGYCKASDVARNIFEELEKTLNRKIARSKPQFDKLHQNEKDLSIWGYKDMGYFQGIIATCEDLQDLIAELKKKYTEEGK